MLMKTAKVAALGLLFPVLGYAEWVKIDDFQSYPPDNLPKQANRWTAAAEKVSQTTVCADALISGNQALKLHRDDGVKSGFDDIIYQTGAVDIAPGKTGTVFIRFLLESGLDKSLGSTRGEVPVENVHVKIALTEQKLNTGSPRVGVFIRGKEASLTGLGSKLPDGKALAIKRNRWYSLWIVVDNRPAGQGADSKAFLLEDGSTEKPLQVKYRLEANAKEPTGILTSVGVIKARDNGLTDLMIDDLFVDNSGVNLSNPLSAKNAMGWQEKLLREAKQYAHLLKKTATLEQADKQARQLVEAMSPAERFSLVCGDGLGIPAFARLGIPSINFSDASAGLNNGNAMVVARHPKTVAYPCTLLLAATWDSGLAKVYGASIGEECRSGGTDILLGPGMNLYHTAIGGRNFEYMGEDPVLTGDMVAEYVRGLQAAGTGATLKHFIANEIEFHRRGSNSQVDERTLHELYMEPFRKGVEAGALAVMTSYNQLNGEWAGQSKYVNTELLRDTLGFKGIIMTDWLSTYDGVKLAQSGTDLEMPRGFALNKDKEKLFGTPEIDRMARNVIANCIFAGFYDRPQKNVDLEKNRPEWEKTALRVNHDGIVLLKNNGLLPVAKQQTGKKILVAGNFAQRLELAGEGSGHVKGYNLKTYTQALKECFPDAELTGVEKPDEAQMKAADLVIFFSGFAREGEARDTKFVLADDELIARCVEMNPKTLVCIISGCGARMDWCAKAAGVMYLFFGGQTGSAAFIDILTGAVNPSGHLPFTIENRIEDSPAVAVLSPKPDKEHPYSSDYLANYVKGEFYASEDKKSYFVHNVNYAEGVFNGYRWYEAKKIPVRFPFGHGLSYTSFSYDKLKLEKTGKESVRLSFIMRNDGTTAGADVAQIYVSDKECKVPRPAKELKTFQKVRLQAGESKQVEIQLGAEAFRFWDAQTKKWTVEPGEFEISVGVSSADIKLTDKVVLSSH